MCMCERYPQRHIHESRQRSRRRHKSSFNKLAGGWMGACVPPPLSACVFVCMRARCVNMFLYVCVCVRCMFDKPSKMFNYTSGDLIYTKYICIHTHTTARTNLLLLPFTLFMHFTLCYKHKLTISFRLQTLRQHTMAHALFNCMFVCFCI